jgi:hypothetical protein
VRIPQVAENRRIARIREVDIHLGLLSMRAFR